MNDSTTSGCTSRSEAIACGELKDLTKMANGYGFQHPFAVTKDVWNRCLIDDDMLAIKYRATALLRCIMNSRQRQQGLRKFNIHWVIPTPQWRPFRLWLTVEWHAGDDAETVVTIRVADER